MNTFLVKMGYKSVFGRWDKREILFDLVVLVFLGLIAYGIASC